MLFRLLGLLLKRATYYTPHVMKSCGTLLLAALNDSKSAKEDRKK
jgi:hypothetical protein